MTYRELNKLLGNLDLYLLDSILKGRFDGKTNILDAGCGEGRNIKYFVENGYNVTGIDDNQEAINFARLIFKGRAEFIHTSIESLELMEPFDGIISVNVLHHTHNESDFLKQWKSLLKVLKPGGILFIRTLVHHGAEPFIRDDNEHLLINKSRLDHLVKETELHWAEPIKLESWEGLNLGVIVLEKSI